jgi:hypothetical protein
VAFELRDYFETVDGSRPDAQSFSEAEAKKYPLAAMQVLAGGDVFENTGGHTNGLAMVQDYIQDKVKIRRNDCDESLELKCIQDMIRLIRHNPFLVQRLASCIPIEVDLVPEGKTLPQYGFPKQTTPSVSGMFWFQHDWDAARIGLRADRLSSTKALVAHEFAHAIHYLAFTKKERELIYTVLRPTFGSRSAMDEVFAIYSEQEFLTGGKKNNPDSSTGAQSAFQDAGKAAPGVYGFTRKQWNENHVFTRFVRKLYYPQEKPAGSGLAGGNAWKKFSGG